MRQFRAALASLAVLFVALSPAAAADKKPIKPNKMWSGSVADQALQKDAPRVIVNAKDLEKLWKAWMIKDEMPKVDFEKEIVVIATTVGSRLNLNVVLD